MSILKSRKTLSIDFSSSNIKVVEGKFSKKGISIYNKFSIDLPRGVYEDGYILNIHQLNELISESFKSNKVTTDDVNAVINSSQIITREIVMPKVPIKEIESILSYQVEEFIPIRPEDYVVQCIILDTIYEETVEKYSLLLVGIPKDMVESHLNLFKNLNIKPSVLDFQGNAINKLIGISEKINGKYEIGDMVIASIDIGYDITKLTIMQNNNIKITRIINMGISEALEETSQKLELSREELDEILKTLSLDAKYPEGSREEQVKNLLRSNFEHLFENIEMIFRYYRTRDVGNQIDLILLQGSISEFKCLGKLFKEYFQIESVLFETINTVTTEEPMWRYANAIGGLIRMNEV